MTKRIIALLLALILTVGLLPTVALAADGTANSDVVSGSIGTDGKWSQTSPAQPTVEGVKTVNKTATRIKDNKYQVTLTVVLEQTEEEQKPGAAATVLVLDTSGSMAYCAECGENDPCEHTKYEEFTGTKDSGAEYYYKDGNDYKRAYYCSGYHDYGNQHHQPGWFKSTQAMHERQDGNELKNQTFYTATRTSRLDAAKTAAQNFLKTYSGLTFNTDGTVATGQESKDLDRYVSVVTFAKSVTLQQGWIDVSNPTGYNTVKNLLAGESLKADGGTNLDAGLCYAEYLLKQSAVKDATKNVIALSDGEPTFYLSTSDKCYSGNCGGGDTSVRIGNATYYVHGRGSSCNNTTKESTDSAAADVKKVPADLYTICFGGANEMMKKPDNGNWGFTVGKYMESLASEKDGKKLAYTASNANELNTAFAAITSKIISGLNTGTVKDSLPAGITSTDFGDATQLEFNDEKQFTKTKSTETVGDKTVTTYTYTKTYTVTIDPDDKNLVTTEDGYAPLNGETTLTVTVDGEKKEIPFPIPAGKVTPKQYTVTGTIDNNGTVNSEALSYTETVESGKTSMAMTFVPATGYVITKITEKIGDAAETEITVSDANKNSYTYDAKTVTADITVTVETAPRGDLSYTIRYLEKDTENVIKDPDTVVNQTFGTEINVASMDKPTIPGYSYNSCDPVDKLTISTGENVITLYYTKNKHNINYVYAAGSPNNAPSLDSYNEIDVPVGSPKTRKGAPTLDGWTFNGWQTGDVEVDGSGNFTMPDKDVTFTGSWTQRATATINYVVVPNGAGTLSSYSETKYVDDTTAAAGSTAIPATGGATRYRFVGWYAEEACTTLLTEDTSFIPTKTGDKWTSATYYAKFEAIPTPGADDLPKVDVICKNTVMGHAASENNVLVDGTYTVGETQYADGTYTCKVTLNQTQGYIDTYNSSNSGHTDDAANANVVEITLTYDATTQTWTKSENTFKIYVICDTTQFDVEYTWTGLDGVTFETTVKPEPPATVKVTKGGEHTVDTEYKAGDIRVATNGDKYRFSGWSTTDATIGTDGRITNIQKNITLSGEWTKLGNGTFDLNDKIFKVFDEADGSRDIPRSSYTFEVKVTRLDKETNELTDEEYTGTVTQYVATGATASWFAFNNTITFHTGGEYKFLVEETPNTVTTLSSDERITYDNAKYYLYVTVSDDLNTINYRFEPVRVITSVEEEPAALDDQKIFFYNYYFAEKDPDKLYLDFSEYVKKELTATGSKTASDVNFTVNVKESPIPVISSTQGEEAVSTYAGELLSTTLNAHFDNITGGETKTEQFIGSIEIKNAGVYRFELTEVDGQRTGVTYDDSTYILNVTVNEENGKLVVGSYSIIKDGYFVSDATITFHNTIDTGKDDYYPIIIPTIVGKDTGMLNKTDHFAYVIGYPDGTVHPNGQITRAEVATIFFRLLRDEVRDGAFTTSNSYSDVAYGKWYNNPISTMSALGIITGYPDGTFKPNKPITRAEFAAIAARFDETQSGKSATFSDVIGHWAAKEIGIAYYNDWIKGYPDGTFKPDQNITRAEAMTLINRVLERKPESPADLLTDMNIWTDNMDTSKWYYLDVQEATNSHGYTRKTFNYELWRQMLTDPDWSRYER